MKKRAVLVLNIGSPETTEVNDVQNYLNRFLMDPYVVTAPFLVRWLFMKNFIIPRRAPRSSEAYKKIWTKEGSPLIAYTKKLINNLNTIDSENKWFCAMRYSNPDVLETLSQIRNEGFKELVIFPVYPQYASSSTASTFSFVDEKLNIMNWQPKIYKIEEFYNDIDFINNITLEVPKSINLEEFDHVLFSFHGLPENHLKKINSECQFSDCCLEINSKNKKCYRAQCYQTAKLVAEKLNLDKTKWSMSFQSRLGPLKWIEPYTDKVVIDLVQSQNVKKILVFSLAFVTDCLETLEELDMALKESFLNAGGEKFVRVPCLNDKFYSAQAIVNKTIMTK